MAIKEKAFDVDHINTTKELNNLGNDLNHQGRYNEAIQYFTRVLKIKETIYGVDHIESASTIGNLGTTYYHQGKYDLAKVQYAHALRIKEQFSASAMLKLPMN